MSGRAASGRGLSRPTPGKGPHALKDPSDDLRTPRADGETGGPAVTPDAPQNTKDETIMPTNVAEPKARPRQYRFPEIPGRLEKDLVQVFKLLSDETRLRVLLYLAREGELHVTALCEKLDQSQPAVSHHPPCCGWPD